MNPYGQATLHKRGGGPLIDRWLATGTLKALVQHVMSLPPDKRREVMIIHDDMEFQPAEIENLSGQYIFSDDNKRVQAIAASRPSRKSF